MTTYGRNVCPHKSNCADHDWYSHILIFGLAIVRKCRTCGARRVF